MQEEAAERIDAGLRAAFHDDNAVAAQVLLFGLELTESAVQAGSDQAGKLAPESATSTPLTRSQSPSPTSATKPRTNAG